MNILFPSNTDNKIRYYDVHYRYLLNVFRAAGVKVEFFDGPQTGENSFVIRVKGIPVLIDFGDHTTVSKWLNEYPICFKYHYSRSQHLGKYKSMFPIGCVSFHDWSVYGLRKQNIQYTCNSDVVLNNQRPGGNATERRMLVQKTLREQYGPDKIDTRFYKRQETFWDLINNCLVSVCVPGARNNILDRGQVQYMALGCCTISPVLDIVLPGKESFEPGVHYIGCESDYSDLTEKIEWCKGHRPKCVGMGKHAAKVFSRTLTPGRIRKWMEEKIGEIRK
ncbi:MAG: hypothetical protein ACTSWQ_09925 [Candidatus Thorarchaeota archaeon]